MNAPRAMILAAGRGERMRPLTDTAPKPLLHAGGKSLLEHHLQALAAAGFERVVINLAWKGEMIRQALGDGVRFGVSIEYSEEGGTALETGGGICNALPLLGDGPFLVVSGDIWTQFDFRKALAELRPDDLAHLVLVPNPSFHPRGDFGLRSGRLCDSDPRYTYANIGVFRPEFFAGQRPGVFPLAPLIYEWIRRDRVSGQLYEGPWRNIGAPEQLAELDRDLTATN